MSNSETVALISWNEIRITWAYEIRFGFYSSVHRIALAYMLRRVPLLNAGQFKNWMKKPPTL